MFGKKNRLRRVFNENGKCVMLALDHGMALGPMRGIEDPRKTLSLLANEVDSIMLNKGILRNCYEPDGKVGIVLRISGGATIAGDDLTRESLVTTVEEALRISADAVATSIFVGTPNEHSTIESLSLLCDECQVYGLPVLAVTAVGKGIKEKKSDPKYMALAVRVAAEMGADIIKTYYCREGFEKIITAAAGVPVVIAGGPKMETPLEVLDIAERSIKAGAAGVDMGRNVWQDENPVAMLRALKAIINDGMNATDAYKKFYEV